MEERNLVPVSMEAKALSPQALKQLRTQLSGDELNYEVARQAVKGLAVPTQVLAVKFAAQALSSSAPTVDLQECSSKDSYETIETAFSGLLANLTAANSSLYAREDALRTDADAAKARWLDAQSAFRTAQATKDSAKSAATYADGMYTKYSTAVTEGQTQNDQVC